MLQIKNIDTPEPIIEIYEPIGSISIGDGTYIGVSGTDFSSALNYLNTLSGLKCIKVYINSDGGRTSDGQSMYAAIKSSKTPVYTVNVGTCVSMAGVVLQAGKKRQMVSWGGMMIHPPSGGDLKDLQGLKPVLIGMLCEASGMDAAEMEKIMDATTWLSATECLELKLIDEIIDISTDVEIPKIEKNATPSMAYMSMMNVVNSLNEKKNDNIIKTKKMDKLISHLNLHAGATEIDALNVIKEREAKSKLLMKSVYNARKAAKKDDETEPDPDEEPENAMKDLAKKIENLTKECDNLRNSLNTKTEECDALNKAKTEAEDKMKASEAEDVINSAVNAGKITKESKDNWIGMYIADKEHTNLLLGSVGFVKTNPAMNVKPVTRKEVSNLGRENYKNGIRQVEHTEASTEESPFAKLARERAESVKKATENYKNRK